MYRIVVAVTILVGLLTGMAVSADHGLKAGNPDLQSAGPLTFGPDGILFVGDTIYPHAPIILANKDSDLNAFKASIASLVDFGREQEEKPPSASDCGAVESAAVNVIELALIALSEASSTVAPIAT